MLEPARADGYDTFLFDLDGTLLDTLPDLVRLTNQVLRELGMPERTEAEILSFVGNGVRALMRQAVPADAAPEQVEAAMERWAALFPTYPNDLTKPYPGVVELLEELRARGCKVGVMSNKFAAGVDQIVEQCLPGLLDVARGEGPDVPRKPDPTGLLLDMEDLGATPERCVFVGDSPSDIRAGRNAGMATVAVEWGYHPPADFDEVAPDYRVRQPEELLALAAGGRS